MKKDFNRLLFQPFVKLQLSLLLSEPQKSVSESNFYSNQLQSAEITLKTSDAAFFPSVGFIHQLLWASDVDERHIFYIVITRNIWKWRNILCRKLHSRTDYQFVCSFLRLSSAAQSLQWKFWPWRVSRHQDFNERSLCLFVTSCFIWSQSSNATIRSNLRGQTLSSKLMKSLRLRLVLVQNNTRSCKRVNSPRHQWNYSNTRRSFCSLFGVNTDGCVFKPALP